VSRCDRVDGVAHRHAEGAGVGDVDAAIEPRIDDRFAQRNGVWRLVAAV
jgi:hypothetical protein